MGTIKRGVQQLFGAGSKEAQKTAWTMAVQAAIQADAIRAAGAEQAAATRVAAESQTKQLQDQQQSANMALQQSMNQRVLATQLEEQAPVPEREAQVDLAANVSTDTSDPRRKFQSQRTSGVGIKVA